MAALRIFALESKSPQDEIEQQFKQLADLDLGSFDRSRLDNYHTLYLLKTNQLQKALENLSLNDEKIANSSSFDLFWILNVVNTVLLQSAELNLHIKETLIARLDDQRLLNMAHPNDIIWREAALHFWLLKDKSRALKFIKRAQTVFNLKNSPISGLLNDMNAIFEAVFKGKLPDTVNKLEYLKLNASDLKDERVLIQKIKHLSPY